MPDETIIAGAIERITFYNPDTGYAVLKIIPHKDYPSAIARDGTLAVVGVMPELAEGEEAEFTGYWVDNPQYGRQFRAERVMPVAPRSERGIVRYIADTVFGIGEVTAQRIYRHFGERTLEILDLAPERIREVPGLKPNLARNLIETWTTNRAERNAIVYLQGLGLTSHTARKIYAQYGPRTQFIVEANPYQLAEEIRGIGFRKSDEIARALGLPADSVERLRAGVAYALGELTSEGHTFAPRPLLVEKACDLLRVSDREAVARVIDEQVLANRLIGEDLVRDGEAVQAVYLPFFHRAEEEVTQRLRDMAQTPSRLVFKARTLKWETYLSDLAGRNDVALSEAQQGAVRAALTSKVSVLTGGPGTGKTTTLQMVIHALDDLGFQYRLTSPTGRAAKRLGEATQQQAQTIHRLLGFNPSFDEDSGGWSPFEHDEDNPLETDVLVVDESSMIDLMLFDHLLRALRPTTHLMLVGDVDQLPSVGAGNVLRDVIDSGIGHVTRLDKIFRQDDKSHIVLNAHRINQGEMPFTDNRSEDFFFFGVDGGDGTAEMVVDVVSNRIPSRFDLDPMRDVQVIAPMYRGPAGVDNLNHILQDMLNPGGRKAEKRINRAIFRHDDKVMQTRNNYEKEVFNGDIGIIHRIYDDHLTVLIDDREVPYDFNEAEELIHAYCISTHRSQGSEYPAVVMPILGQHYMMLQRNLLYTAITRARRLVVLVGERKAVAIAVNNNKVAERYSGLLARLRG